MSLQTESRDVGEQPATLEATFEAITPEMAERYIGTNDANRHLRRDTVIAYARDMTEGRWQLTGQGISFDMQGALVDGQHRMRAIVESQKTITMLVVRGAHPSVIKVLDSGVKRIASDYLGLASVPYRIVLAAVARLSLLFDEDSIGNQHRQVSNAELLDYIDENFAELTRAAERATHYRATIPTTTSVLGTTYFLLRRHNIASATEFFESMSTQSLTGAGDPRLLLVRRLTVMRTERTRANQAYTLDLFLRAWNAWRSGERMVIPQINRRPRLPTISD
jgi:hypothetical protein